MNPTASTTKIAWPLKAWMGAEVFFGVATIVTVFLRPQDTATNFAWPIQPAVMAATLGAFYVSTALLFVLPLFGKAWEEVRVVVLPSAAFSTVMLAATVLHWDKFSHGTAPFVIWLASYVLPPPIFSGLYVWHQRRAAPVGHGVGRPLAGWARAFLRGNGALLVLFALAAFAVPGLLIRSAPWKVTPLTARALCGWLVGLGLLQLWMAWENDWRRVRLATTMLLILPPALALQLARFRTEADWTRPALWILLADVAASAAVALALGRRAGRSTAG